MECWKRIEGRTDLLCRRHDHLGHHGVNGELCHLSPKLHDIQWSAPPCISVPPPSMHAGLTVVSSPCGSAPPPPPPPPPQGIRVCRVAMQDLQWSATPCISVPPLYACRTYSGQLPMWFSPPPPPPPPPPHTHRALG